MIDVVGINVSNERCLFTFKNTRHELSLDGVRDYGRLMHIVFKLKPFIRKTKDILVVRKQPEIAHWWLNTVRDQIIKHGPNEKQDSYLGEKTEFSKFNVEIGFNIFDNWDGPFSAKVDGFIEFLHRVNQNAYRDFVTMHTRDGCTGVEIFGTGNNTDKEVYTKEEVLSYGNSSFNSNGH